MSFTRYPNGVKTFVVPDDAETISAATDTTVIGTTGANGDCGKTFVVTLTSVITIPAIAIGNTFTYVNGGKDGEVQITLSPQAGDGISWVGSATDDKDLINTLATAKKGDFVTIAALDQTVAWQVVASSGIWAKE